MFWNVATKEICLNWISNHFEAWLPSCLEQKGNDHLRQKPESQLRANRQEQIDSYNTRWRHLYFAGWGGVIAIGKSFRIVRVCVRS